MKIYKRIVLVFFMILTSSYFVTADVTIQVSSGWNSIGIPYEGYKAQDILDRFNTGAEICTEIDRWYAGGWDSHINDLSFNNFDIVPGQGYYVECTDSATTIFTEDLPSFVNIEVGVGNSYISIPYEGYEAPDLLDEVNELGAECVEVSRWYEGEWDVYEDGSSVNDYDINPNVGYFLKCSNYAD